MGPRLMNAVDGGARGKAGAAERVNGGASEVLIVDVVDDGDVRRAAVGREGGVGVEGRLRAALSSFLVCSVSLLAADARTVFVTGGASGIGRAIAKAYIHHGARVAVNFYPDEKSRENFRTLREECRGEIVDYYGRGEEDARGEEKRERN